MNRKASWEQKSSRQRVILSITVLLILSLTLIPPVQLHLPSASTSNRSCSGGTSPSITPSTQSAEPGQLITITGSGFSSCDTSITAAYFGNTITPIPLVPASGCSANSGSFTCYFVVPDNPKIVTIQDPGITVIGSTGDAANDTAFLITKGFGIYPTYGPPGTVVSVYGNVFSAYSVYTGIFFGPQGNGELVACGDPFGVGCKNSYTNPSGEGCFAMYFGNLNNYAPCKFEVPQEPNGVYTVDICAYLPGSICLTPEMTTFDVSTTAPAPTVPSMDAPAGSIIQVTTTQFPSGDTIDPMLNGEALLTPANLNGSNLKGGCPNNPSGQETCAVQVPTYWGSGNPVVPGEYTLSAQGFPSGVTSNPANFWVSGPFPLHLTPNNAKPGSIITVDGNALNPNDTSANLSFNGNNVTPSGGCPVSSGSFTCEFILPLASSPGNYVVTATGNNASDTDSATVSVLPGIIASPLAASVGNQVMVSGIGLSLSDTSVTLALNGTDIVLSTGCSASSGSFSCMVNVPNLSGGAYNLTAIGTSGDTFSTGFVIASGIYLLPGIIGPGNNVTIIGQGFSASDSTISIKFNGQVVTPFSPCLSSSGTFDCSFVVPKVTSGVYLVNASGSADSAVANLTVVPSITLSPDILNPSTNPAGSTISVNGSGFSSSDSKVSLEFQSFFIPQTQSIGPSGGCPVTSGAFSCTFNLPSPYQSMNYTVLANGTSGDNAVAPLVENPSITAAPTTVPKSILGYAPSQIEIRGIGFSVHGETITFSMDGVTLNPVNLLCSALGNLSCVVYLPSSVPPGHYILSATGQEFGETASAPVSVIGIEANVTFGKVGSNVTIGGGGFSYSDTSVTLKFGSGNVTPSGGCPVSVGAFSCQIAVPSLAPYGYNITATGISDNASLSFDVVNVTLSTYSSPFLQGMGEVSFSGSGFLHSDQGGGELGFNILFNGQVIGQTGTVINGSFGGTFTVPLGTTNSNLTLYNPYSGEYYSIQFQIPNVNSYDQISATFSGGRAIADSKVTGVNVSIVGSPLTNGTQVVIQSANLSTFGLFSQYYPFPQNFKPTSYFAIGLLDPVPSSNGTIEMCFPSTKTSTNDATYMNFTWASPLNMTSNGKSVCGYLPFTRIQPVGQSINLAAFFATGILTDPTSTLITCLPNANATTCTGSVLDSNYPHLIPSGTLNWNYSGVTGGSFVSSSCQLNLEGICSVTFNAPSGGGGTIAIGSSYAPNAQDRGLHVGSSSVASLDFVKYSTGGVGSDATGIPLTLGSSMYQYSELPFVAWYSNGTRASYSFVSTISAGTGKLYSFSSLTGCSQNSKSGSFVVSGSCSIAATYLTEYNVTMTSGKGIVNLEFLGNDSSIQLSDLTLHSSSNSYDLSFNVTGTTGTFANETITIPKFAVPNGSDPTVSVNGAPPQYQSYTQDANNFYVTFTAHISTDQVSIVFSRANLSTTSTTSSTTTSTSNSQQTQTRSTTTKTNHSTSSTLQEPVSLEDYGLAFIAIVIVGVFGFFFAVRRKR